jgi:hypothetical protein
MSYLRTYPLANSAVLRIYSEKDRINVEPWYQRRGEVWTLEKRQLLIDSILNDYDIPKLYFHSFTSRDRSEYGNFDYAIIDGRQRLEAIWDFADDGFPLSDDFIYLADSKVNAGGKKYSELSSAFPKLKIRFDSFNVPIMCIETDDTELIEEMFSRLNEAVPLNAAEKRNAIGGPMAQCIRNIAEHNFFEERVKFSDARYKHRESAAHLLFLEYTILFQNKIIDTKKPYLDAMVRDYKSGKAKRLEEVRNRTLRILDPFSDVFEISDALLRTQSITPVYYLAFRTAVNTGKQNLFKRDKLEEFNLAIKQNKDIAAVDIANANFDYLEFDSMNRQGTNDAASIKERTRILCKYLGISIPRDSPIG